MKVKQILGFYFLLDIFVFSFGVSIYEPVEAFWQGRNEGYNFAAILHNKMSFYPTFFFTEILTTFCAFTRSEIRVLICKPDKYLCTICTHTTKLGWMWR